MTDEYLSNNPPIVEYVNGAQPETADTNQQVPAPEAESAPPDQEGQTQDNQEPAPSVEGDDPKFAARFAALSRKEKELIQRERAFKEQQAQIQAYQKAMERAKQNPLEYLQAAGLTLEEALQRIINEDKEPTEQDRIKNIEDQIEAYKKQQMEYAQRAQEYKKQQELQSIHQQISEYVQQNSEQFEAVSAYNAIDTVWQVIERTYVETQGQVHLTMEQACQAVEDDLIEQAKEEQSRHAKLKKLQQKLMAAEGSSESNPKEVSNRISPTLTNNSGVTTSTPKKFKSREESLKEAAKLLKWNE